MPDTSTADGYLHVKAALKSLTDACLATLGGSAPYFSTTATAKDLDLLREQLGDEQLSYVGFSYGAKLGGEYARQFPSRVRARDTPIPSGRPGDDQPATDATVIALLYDDRDWAYLDEALRDAECGDSGGLFEAQEHADGGEHRDGDPPTEVDVEQAGFVITCNDSAPGPTEAAARASAAQLIARYPVFGRYGAWSLTLCQQWRPERHPVVVGPVLTSPLLVVGTVHDPATPYEGAVAFAGALGTAATLLTWEGQGHTAFLRSSCIDAAVQQYLLTLAAPATGARCPASP